MTQDDIPTRVADCRILGAMGRRKIQDEPRARILYRVNEAATALGISRAKRGKGRARDGFGELGRP